MSSLPPLRKGPWQVLSDEIVYDNAWITVRHQDVITPAGTQGIYGVVQFKNVAVGILPVDDDGNTWLVKQYRYPLCEDSWEIPEGGSPAGESTLDTARRELKEETGLSANRWTELLVTRPSNSVTDEKVIVYLAEGLTAGEADPEDSEDLVIKKLPLVQAVQMVLSGEITDGISVAALLKLALLRGICPQAPDASIDV